MLIVDVNPVMEEVNTVESIWNPVHVAYVKVVVEPVLSRSPNARSFLTGCA